MNYWLMKSEPDEFSFQDLYGEPKRRASWDGVRNFQARNFMKQMRLKDLAFFYHSNCATPGIVGIMEIAALAYPDHTAFDPDDPHFDPKSDPENPRWYMVDVRYKRKLKKEISLAELRTYENALDGFALLRRGNRLSVMPVSAKHWNFIIKQESRSSKAR